MTQDRFPESPGPNRGFRRWGVPSVGFWGPFG